jgi:hypothetical protein
MRATGCALSATKDLGGRVKERMNLLVHFPLV